MKHFLLAAGALLLASAAQAQLAAYDFKHPAATYELPKELHEISGHALLPGQRVGCIQDQSGTLYVYNLKTRKIDQKLAFGPKGDYEDVARMNGYWLILRSDGTLLKYTDQGAATTYRTGLTAANNPEGLTYDAASGALLVACKGSANVGQPDQKRAIYRLDPATYRAGAKPAYLLDVAQLIALDREQDRKDPLARFAPSAVAVHPLSHHVFVLAASGNALVELDAQGKPLGVTRLGRKHFPQPEGLAFAANGDLYVSSEKGDTGDAGLIQFFRMTPGGAR